MANAFEACSSKSFFTLKLKVDVNQQKFLTLSIPCSVLVERLEDGAILGLINYHFAAADDD